MSKFVLEVRKKDGSPFPPDSLYQLSAGLQRYLRENGVPELTHIKQLSYKTCRSCSALFYVHIWKLLTIFGVCSMFVSQKRAFFKLNFIQTYRNSSENTILGRPFCFYAKKRLETRHRVTDV